MANTIALNVNDMSKAEEQALKVYPIKEEWMGNQWDGVLIDVNATIRDGFIEGYNQAQQDYIEYAQLWVDSGEVNIKSFKQFLKDRGYE